jgi:D-alanyl-D-alanine dipeptidase
MRKAHLGLVMAALITGALPAMIVTAVAADAAAPAHYSVSTTLIGKLLDDPAAAAVIKKLAPTAFANDMFHTQGRELTLKAVQQYEPEFTDENLAKIQAEFDKLPAKG